MQCEIEVGNHRRAALVGEARCVALRTHLPKNVCRHEHGRAVAAGREDLDVELHSAVGIEERETRPVVPVSRREPRRQVEERSRVGRELLCRDRRRQHGDERRGEGDANEESPEAGRPAAPR